MLPKLTRYRHYCHFTFSFAPVIGDICPLLILYPFQMVICRKQINVPQVGKIPRPFSPSLLIYDMTIGLSFFLPVRMFGLQAVLQEDTAELFLIPSTALFIFLFSPSFISSLCKEQATTRKTYPNHRAGVEKRENVAVA